MEKTSCHSMMFPNLFTRSSGYRLDSSPLGMRWALHSALRRSIAQNCTKKGLQFRSKKSRAWSTSKKSSYLKCWCLKSPYLKYCFFHTHMILSKRDTVIYIQGSMFFLTKIFMHSITKVCNKRVFDSLINYSRRNESIQSTPIQKQP